MSQSLKSSFLQDEIGLLVQHFGVERVRAALTNVANGAVDDAQKPNRRNAPRNHQPSRPSVATALESIRETDPEKYRLLDEFLSHLRDRKVLPESHDIRHFALRIGLKDIAGKSRKDMIPPLMRFLLDQPSERLRTELKNAKNISEQQRQQGFSVLTDKLLGEN